MDPNADPAAVAAAVIETGAQFYRQINEPLHAAAVEQHLQSVSNGTVGNVSVVIGVPKGVTETDPANTKVVMYMHGKLTTATAAAKEQCTQPGRSAPNGIAPSTGIAHNKAWQTVSPRAAAPLRLFSADMQQCMHAKLQAI
jgi:hypothetical protein